MVLRVEASSIRDAAGTNLTGGVSLLLQTQEPGWPGGPGGSGGATLDPVVLALGSREAVLHHPASESARSLDLQGSTLVPALVNAHTHLDLTHIGPRAHDPKSGFVAFVDLVRRERAGNEADIAASVRRGVQLSLAGGVVAVGDIAGASGGRLTFAPLQALSQSPLRGVSFLEFFAMGRREAASLERLREALETLPAGTPRVRAGLQPHATYSVSPPAFREALRLASRWSLPVSTHLAETFEEREFIARGTGPLRDMLERLGVWEDSILDHVAQGRSPVEHLCAGVDPPRGLLAAHVADASERDIQRLAASGIVVAYCPRAGSYFATHERLGPHRYREMLRAGVAVALGTDSIVNLPAEHASGAHARISTWDDMVLLSRRDGTDAETLLAMATLHGARALGVDDGLFRFRVGGTIAGVCVLGAPTLELALARGVAPGLLGGATR